VLVRAPVRLVEERLAVVPDPQVQPERVQPEPPALELRAAPLVAVVQVPARQVSLHRLGPVLAVEPQVDPAEEL
jgi:hypothetical protein